MIHEVLSTDRSTRRWGCRRWGWMFATCLLVLGGCSSSPSDSQGDSSDPSGDPDTGVAEDTVEPGGGGPDTKGDEETGVPDTGPAGDVDLDDTDVPEQDVARDVIEEADTRRDGGRDATRDGMGGETGTAGDSDGDGVPDEEDNCPDTANPDQKDRDRDGIGDACDPFPYVHDPDNPQDLEFQPEDEPNDSIRSQFNDKQEFPILIDGDVGAIERGRSDRDFFTFEIEEPTALLFHMEAQTGEMWNGGLLLGYRFRNGNINNLVSGEGNGQDTTRGMYLAAPGDYVFVASDFRNLLPDSQAQNVGGSSRLQYRLSISKVPLPEPTRSGVPTTQTYKSSGRLRTFRLDTSGVSALNISARGVPLAGDDRAVHLPLFALYDPNEERVLSYIIQRQLDSQRRQGKLATKLAGQDEVLLIAGSYRTVGNNRVVYQASETQVNEEFETVRQPEDPRQGRHVWIQPGASPVEGTIGPPRNSGPQSLSPDVDYHLMMANPGDKVRVTLEPTSGSSFIPDLRLGNYYLEPGSSDSEFETRDAPNVPSAEKTDQSRTIEFIYDQPMMGEVAARVRHAPNSGSDNPVGGSSYGYRLSVDKWDPQPVKVQSFPTTKEQVLEPGDLGVFELQVQPGEVIQIDPQTPDGVDFDGESRLYRTSDWQRFDDNDFDGMTLSVANSGTFWYDVRDEDGRGTQGQPLQIKFTKISPKELNNFPAKVNDSIDSSEQADYYYVPAQSGDQFDFIIETASFDPRMRIYELPGFDLRGFTLDQKTLAADRDGGFIVKINPDDSDASGSYTLGVDKIQPNQLGQPPASDSGTLDNPPFRAWYEIPVNKDRIYKVSYNRTGRQFDDRLYVFDPSDMDTIERGFSSPVRFQASSDGSVYIALFDDENRGGSNFTYDISVEEFSVESLSTNTQKQGTLSNGQEQKIYLFDTQTGAVDLSVEAQGSWTPEVSLLEQGGDLDDIDDATPYRGIIRYASDSSQNYAAVVTARDSSRSGPLNYTIEAKTISPSNPTAENEPNNTDQEAQIISSTPTVVDGSLGNSGDSVDRFQIDLQAGQRIWAIAAEQGNNSLIPRIRLYNPSGNRVESDRLDGPGLFPALTAEQVDETGTWQVALERNDNDESGNYYLYFFTSEALTFSESEPNNNQSEAQNLQTIDAPSRIRTEVGPNDTTDVFEFELTRDLETLRLFLQDASDGHNLVLRDSSFNVVKAQGPAHGGDSQPDFEASNLDAGTYYVELGQGNVGNREQVDIEMRLTP